MENIIQNATIKVAAGTAGRIYFLPPNASRKWKIKSLSWIPNATSTAHASNYATITTIKGASTTVATARDTSTGTGSTLTQGTAENGTISAVGEDAEITQSAPLSIRVAHSGTGVAIDLAVQVEFEEMRV